MYRNLAALWANYAADGRIDRLLLEKLVDHRSNLSPLYDAIPNTQLTIVRLHTPLALIEERLRRREPNPESEISAARWWAPRANQSATGQISCRRACAGAGRRPRRL